MTDGATVDRGGAGVAVTRHNHYVCRHEWRFVSDEVDEFGHIQMFECRACGHVHFT